MKNLEHFETDKTKSSFGLNLHYSGFSTIIAIDYTVLVVDNTWFTLPVILEGEIVICN